VGVKTYWAQSRGSQKGRGGKKKRAQKLTAMERTKNRGDDNGVNEIWHSTRDSGWKMKATALNRRGADKNSRKADMEKRGYWKFGSTRRLTQWSRGKNRKRRKGDKKISSAKERVATKRQNSVGTAAQVEGFGGTIPSCVGGKFKKLGDGPQKGPTLKRVQRGWTRKSKKPKKRGERGPS